MGKLSEGLLDLCLRGVLGDPQQLVVVFQRPDPALLLEFGDIGGGQLATVRRSVAFFQTLG